MTIRIAPKKPRRYYINHQIFFKIFFITFRNKMLYP